MENQNQNIQMPTSDDSMMSSFNAQTNKSDLTEIIKQLFNEKKIELISDLSKDEIKLITRIMVIADMKKINIWNKGIRWYLKLVLSKDRKSRREILDILKGIPQQQSLMSKLNPASWGRRF